MCGELLQNENALYYKKMPRIKIHFEENWKGLTFKRIWNSAFPAVKLNFSVSQQKQKCIAENCYHTRRTSSIKRENPSEE